MVIAVNTKYFLKAYQQDYVKFIYDSFCRIASQLPQHTFIFFSNSPFDASISFTPNIVPRVIVPKIKAGRFSGVLYNIKMLSLLKKCRADVFINTDAFCSLLTKVPQCFILHLPRSLSDKEFIKKHHLFLYQKCIPPVLKRVKIIVTESQFSKNYIIQQYKTNGEKIEVIYNSIPDFPRPVEGGEKEKIKARYAGGNEYFIFYGNTSRQDVVLNLLKAFSHFKKWQKSSMQLLIVKQDAPQKDLIESLKLFKYRKDVKLLNKLPPDELTQVGMAAYSTIYLPSHESFFIPGLQAINGDIPLITVNTAPMPEIFGEAVLYVNFNDHADIAEKLMRIFKDEKLRQGIIEKGRKEVQKYNLENTTRLLWHSIIKACG